MGVYDFLWSKKSFGFSLFKVYDEFSLKSGTIQTVNGIRFKYQSQERMLIHYFSPTFKWVPLFMSPYHS